MAFIQKIAGVNAGSMRPVGIVIHNDAGSVGATAQAYSNAIPRMSARQLENGFAHYYIDRFNIYQAMWADHCAWHTANSYGNGSFLGFEVCQSMGASNADFLANEEATFKFVAQKMNELRIPANRNTVRLHKSFSSTACPHRSVALHGDWERCQDYFIDRIKYYQSGGTQIKEADEVKFEDFNNRKIGLNSKGLVFVVRDCKAKIGPANWEKDAPNNFKRGSAWGYSSIMGNWACVGKNVWINLRDCVTKSNRGAETGNYIGQELIFKQNGTTHVSPDFGSKSNKDIKKGSHFVIWDQKRDSKQSLWFNIGGKEWINNRDVDILV